MKYQGLPPVCGNALVVGLTKRSAEQTASQIQHSLNTANQHCPKLNNKLPSVLPIDCESVRCSETIKKRQNESITRIIVTYRGAHNAQQCRKLRIYSHRLATQLQVPVQTALIIGVDMDDTLVEGSSAYEVAERSFVELMCQQGIEPSTANQIRQNNYCLWRFQRGIKIGPELMRLTYVSACQEIYQHDDREVPPDILSECEQIVANIYKVRPTLLPGVDAQLIRLAERGAVMHILTRGDPTSQNRKALETGVLKFAQTITVWDDKTPQYYLDFAKHDLDIPPNALMMVGDSINFDVGFALKAGWGGILVETSRFRLENATTDVPQGAAKIPSFSSIELISALAAKYGLSWPTRP